MLPHEAARQTSLPPTNRPHDRPAGAEAASEAPPPRSRLERSSLINLFGRSKPSASPSSSRIEAELANVAQPPPYHGFGPRSPSPRTSGSKSTRRVSSCRRQGVVFADESPGVDRQQRPNPAPQTLTTDTEARPETRRQVQMDLHAAPDRLATAARLRLAKRARSRASPPPLLDSLPLPISTDDANKVLLLMKTLAGRMRGAMELKTEPDGPWRRGMAYIDDERASLMFDTADAAAAHTAVVPDLRGCRVLPVDHPDPSRKCLELGTGQLPCELLLRPLVADELDLWLAALLCWQQLRPLGARLPEGRHRAPIKQRASVTALKDTAIIKVGKVSLWDQGLATSPRAIAKRPSSGDGRSPKTCWRRVSCILRDNGELKLVAEADVSVIAVIELSQLSRTAVQQLDKTVLDEDFCIAVFPTYAAASTQLSIFRPVYLAFDSRVLFEVWFVLLRAFAVPDLFALDAHHQLFELTDCAAGAAHVCRFERTIGLRVTEARVRTAQHGMSDAHPGAAVGNYLAEVILDGEVRARTTTEYGTRNPFWRQECQFADLPSTLTYLSVILKRVVDGMADAPNPVGAQVTCGSVDIDLHELPRAKPQEQWLPIVNDRKQSIGQMLIRICHEELVVLRSHEYEPLLELLHKFDAGVTVRIAESLPPVHLRRLAELLLNIFQVSGASAEWLMHLAEDEIDGLRTASHAASRKSRLGTRRGSNGDAPEAAAPSNRKPPAGDTGKTLQGDANLLFRGNTLLTSALESHMRRLGQDYLLDTLGHKIMEINKANLNCEVDPARLQPGDDLQQHWAQLIHLLTQMWTMICTTVGRLPPEIRHILKSIQSTAEHRYGDFCRSVSYTSVSGFLFLRFICPSILSPKTHGLMRHHPRPQAQRTLTLIAKGLQTLANLSTIGQKEEWMEPMNRFLYAQRQPFKDYLDQVCSVSQQRIEAIVPASYSTPTTIMARLSPMAREGFPSLPYLLDQPRNLAALVSLWEDENVASEPGADLGAFDTACSDLQQRANLYLARMEALRLEEADAAVGQTVQDGLGLIDAMDQASLHEPRDQRNAAAYGSLPVRLDSRSSASTATTGAGDEASSTSSSSRLGRLAGCDTSTLRPASGPADTIRNLRNATHARKFLSGLMRKRTALPDADLVPDQPLSREKEVKQKDKAGGYSHELGW